MHELSIAQALIKQIEDTAKTEGGGTVTSARIIVGGLSGVDSEALRAVFPIAIEETSLADIRLEIIEDPATIACNQCGARNNPTFPFPICPECESTNVKIEGGQNLILESINISPPKQAP